MRDCCPYCGAKMKRHGSRQLAGFRRAYRDCLECDYRDFVVIRPEAILRIHQISAGGRNEIIHPSTPTTKP